MQKIEDFQVPAEVFYRRQIPGGEISLEASTRSVPHDGQFHVLRRGREVFSGGFEDALSKYHELCRSYWSDQLDGEDEETSLAAAWGLLSLDARDVKAGEVVQRCGTPRDVERLEKMRKGFIARRRAAAARARRTGKPASSKQ